MDKKDYQLLIRKPYWLLLVWFAMLFLWGLFGISLSGVSGTKEVQTHIVAGCHVGPNILNRCTLLHLFFPALFVNFAMVVTFNILLLCFAILLWITLVKTRKPRSSWLAFLLQGLPAFGLLTLVPQVEVVLILSVILTLEATILLKQPRLTLITSCSSVLFLLMVVVLSQQQSLLNVVIPINKGGGSPMTVEGLSFGLSTMGLMGQILLILSIVSYLVLFAQLAYAHVQLATVHLQLQASADRIETLTKLTERQRLARELHDTLTQGLAGVTMQLQAAHAHLIQKHYVQAESMMEPMRETVRTLLAASRTTIYDLRSLAICPEQLPEAVQEEIARFVVATGIICHTDLVLLATFPSDYCEPVLRALGEGLTNIARHAQAQQVWIRITRGEKTFTLEIQDDGIGFDAAQCLVRTGHYGLIGLRERARLLQGEFKITSTPGSGTKFLFKLPFLKTEQTYA